ncbi:hypothetical protein QE197_20170 (plasmid) [Arsenophonus nasoniae]|uniref:HTH-like domain protein n=1 Tax=Arsenophonus nasoniae TaxID=638 RepID=A0ABY8NUR6_9GAMM|nr:hypothetical protein [Arsenophonus nasoniae]WGM08115.1 hypothetical protein QE258_21535 [Arsenophonus nasoniae]WGM12746.1 hypothetical protein QE197_20170 [Arsenophonus nasoniae]WGM17456.1 hypothetical protein QE193_20340 [Arsenophonus nasoniae]
MWRNQTYFYTSGQIYGKRRIQAELKGLGHQIGTYKISNIIKLNQLVAIRPTKKHYYHSSGNEHRYTPNLLKRQFSPEQHNHYYQIRRKTLSFRAGI